MRLLHTMHIAQDGDILSNEDLLLRLDLTDADDAGRPMRLVGIALGAGDTFEIRPRVALDVELAATM